MDLDNSIEKSRKMFIYELKYVYTTKMQKNQIKKTDYKTIGLVALTIFIVVFVSTSLIINYVWGYDFNNSIPYNETMNATINAAHQTEGFMLEQFVENIDNQTLGDIQ